VPRGADVAPAGGAVGGEAPHPGRRGTCWRGCLGTKIGLGRDAPRVFPPQARPLVGRVAWQEERARDGNGCSPSRVRDLAPLVAGGGDLITMRPATVPADGGGAGAEAASGSLLADPPRRSLGAAKSRARHAGSGPAPDQSSAGRRRDDRHSSGGAWGSDLAKATGPARATGVRVPLSRCGRLVGGGCGADRPRLRAGRSAAHQAGVSPLRARDPDRRGQVMRDTASSHATHEVVAWGAAQRPPITRSDQWLSR
jgi:hypothetical protein